MPTLYAMCGLPFAGKSTLARELAVELGVDIVRLDTINHERGLGLDGRAIAPDEWERTYNEAYRRLDRALASGRSIVFDHANFMRSERDEVRAIALRRGASVQFIYVPIAASEARRRLLRNRQSHLRVDVRDDDFNFVITHFEPPDQEPDVVQRSPGEHHSGAPAKPQFDILMFQELSWPALRAEAQFLEGLNVGTLWVADHYAFPPRPDAQVLEAWTTLGALAASTSRVRLGTMVSNVATRHPAMLAKSAATADVISGGRVDIGVGAGGGDGLYRREYDWLGIPPLTRRERVNRLREAVEVITGLLRDSRLTFNGAFYQLDGAPLTPAPVQQPRPPVYVAAQGDNAMRVAAEFADGWVSLGDRSTDDVRAGLRAVRTRNQFLDEDCKRIGRDPSTLERLYLVGWVRAETPFASANAFNEFVLAYQEAGVQRFVFSYISDQRTSAPSLDGRYATRQVLENFAAAAMHELG